MSARIGGKQALVGLIAVFLSIGEGCGDQEACPPSTVTSTVSCETTADCVDEGFLSLRCLNEVCALPCASDVDCMLAPPTEACLEEQGPTMPAVCEAQVCQPACPNVPCTDGQICHQGRCVLAVEDFELRPGDTVASLERFGWNGIPTELSNPKVRLVSEGATGCNLGNETCAGPPASGTRFTVLGTQPTSEKGAAIFAPTCRPCACCLECVLEPYTNTPDARTQCPFGPQVPMPLFCPAEVPASCVELCQACSECPSAVGRTTRDLVSCELTAAERICPSCPSCNDEVCRQCRESACQDACSDDVDSVACQSCEANACPACADCRACEVCNEAESCERVDPSAATCRAKRIACDDLGDTGCYPTPTEYQRSELVPLEQALVSPPYDLSSERGRTVVLSFAYVPFSVGEQYFESQQGVPASMWLRRTQELVVELCPGSCEADSAWVVGMLIQGGVAALPPLDRRNNGLSFGRQTAVDWRAGRVEVEVPETLKTSEFRFRFLPRLDSEALIAVDDIRLERR